MTKVNFLERRQAIRAKRILCIEYKIIKTKRRVYNRNWNLSTTQDMSAIGISFISDVDLSVGDVLELRVVMSGVLDIFKGYAQIVRIQKLKASQYNLIGVQVLERTQTSRGSKSYIPAQGTPPKRSAKRIF